MAYKKSLIFGKGTNDLDYSVHIQDYFGWVDGKRVYKTSFMCPYYTAWHSMLRRCYSKIVHDSHPKYIECEVEPDWLFAKSFKYWMEQQEWEGKHLDKDILGNGLLYSKDTCCFVSPEVNQFVAFSRAKDNGLPCGVQWRKRDKIFCAAIGEGGKRIHLGHFKDPSEAFSCWFNRKQEQMHNLLEKEKLDARVEQAIISLMDKTYQQGMELAAIYSIRSLPSALIDDKIIAGAQNILKAI